MITDFLGIPSDRTDLVAVFCVILAVFLLSIIMTIVLYIRKKPSTKAWAIVLGSSLVLLIAVFCMFRFMDVQSKAQIETNKNAESDTGSTVVDESVTFDEIYRAYKENELRADDVYQHNRYRITAKVNGMETGGLLNLTGGATLTMEKQVDSTIVFFVAEFEKDQEDALKTISVGDTITFEGECLSAGTWEDCELMLD